MYDVSRLAGSSFAAAAGWPGGEIWSLAVWLDEAGPGEEASSETFPSRPARRAFYSPTWQA